ncbi:hypothetical protein, partial [Cytobacillus firmus]|uniref:hypothetical protein n=1 Tax=Cytobacillus firmus TaxID=1399 RepID=UPI001C3F416A
MKPLFVYIVVFHPSMLSVDFRSRMLAFRGAGGEPPRRFASAGSHLSRYSRRSLAPSATINSVNKI